MLDLGRLPMTKPDPGGCNAGTKMSNLLDQLTDHSPIFMDQPLVSPALDNIAVPPSQMVPERFQDVGLFEPGA